MKDRHRGARVLESRPEHHGRDRHGTGFMLLNARISRLVRLEYWWRGCPRCRDETRQRRSIRLELEPFDPRESPTSLLFSSSITASLFAMHPPVSSPPALVQTQTSFVPISIAAETASANFGARSDSDSFGAGSVSDRIPSAQPQETDANRSPAENWAAFSATDDLFPDLFALDPALASKPHSGGSSSAGASDDAHPHSSSTDGGGTSGSGSGFSSANSGAFFGAGSVSDRSLGNASGGLVSSGGSGGSSAPSAPVAHAPGSVIGAPALPTNILLAPTVPLTANPAPAPTQVSPSTPGPTGGISPQDKPGPGPNACISDDSIGTTNVTGLPCGSPGTVFTIDCPTCSGNGNAGVPSDAVNSASGYSAGSPPGIFTEHPVRYGDGVVKLSTTDLESDGFGQAWGQTRSWTNAIGAFPTTALNGTGWIITQLPYLLQATTNNLVLVSNGVNYRYFDFNGSNWVERFYGQETLVSGSPHEFVFTDTTGDQMHFSDFSNGIPTNQQGQLKSWVDPDGNTTSVISRTSDGRPTEVQRSVTVGGTTTTESLLYSYNASNLLSGVVLRRQVNGGAWTIIRQVVYTYYASGEAHGNVGDLKLAVIEDGAGNALDTKYYRYYVNESTGYQHALKYVFNAQSYARLVAALGTNLSSLTDTQVAPYADNYFEYDAGQRVTKEIAQGAGCSSCGGGLGTYLYSYLSSSNTNGYNSWKHKTVETLPDGNQNIVYSNYVREVMLDVYLDTTSNLKWDTFYKFDSAGRVILTAMPSAVTGYDNTKSDLLNFNSQTGLYQYLSNNSGLIQVRDYGTSTTATSSTPGDVIGYLKDTKIEQGQQGTPILQMAAQYIAQTAAGTTVYPVANRSNYRNTDGTGAETTSVTYTFFSGTTQIQSMAVSLPVVSSKSVGRCTTAAVLATVT